MKGETVDIEMKFEEYVAFKIPWKYLHIIYGQLSYTKQFVGSDNLEFHRIFNAVEGALRKKIVREAEAQHIHTCTICHGFVDDRKSNFVRHAYESGYEEYRHTICPNLKEFK